MVNGTILLTNACNLRCRYCYVEKDLINVQTFEHCVKFIDNLLQMNEFNNQITFFGGEPSLCTTLIERVINHYKGTKIKFHMISNGYFLFSDYDKRLSLLETLDSVVITLEGTEKAYNYYRGESGLKEHLVELIRYHNTYKNISINMSLNGCVLDDIEEFSNNFNLCRSNNIPVHIYSIHGDSGINDIVSFYTKMIEIKLKNSLLFDKIIGFNNDIVDSEFLCTFDNTISLSMSGDLINCAYDKRSYGKVTDYNTFNNYHKSILQNHKSLWKGCSNCVVPVGMCQVSCPEYIRECYKNGKIDELEHVCSIERVKQFLRDERSKL